jgi:RHS repeat-associated protein
MRFMGSEIQAGSNNYLYNGKEQQTDFGIHWYDYGARFYDPQLGRFHTLDPLSESYSYQSPFVYAANNPIRFIDWMGMFAGDYYDQKGNYLGTDGIDDQKNYVVTDKKEAKQIKKATKNSENYTASVDSKVELPGYGVRSDMGDAVDRAGTNAFHEEGGVIANMADGSKKVVDAKPGADADPSVDGYAEINVLDAADPSEVKGYSTLDGTFHTHPDGTKTSSSTSSGSISGTTIGGTTTTSYFVQSPSDVDISTHAARSKRGLVTGNSYVLGTGNNTVYIYNGKGVQATFPLQKFRNKLKNE